MLDSMVRNSWLNIAGLLCRALCSLGNSKWSVSMMPWVMGVVAVAPLSMPMLSWPILCLGLSERVGPCLIETAAACRDFVAFVGAIGFTPMDFILPIILWQKVGKHSLITSLINWTIVIFYSIIAILGAIGSVQAIIADVANYNVFADLF